MARVNMEDIIEELDDNFARVLKALIDEISPDNTLEKRTIMRMFRIKLDRGFSHWEHVSDRCVTVE